MPRTTGAFSRARPADDARAKAWTSMRIMVRFTAPQICTTSSIRSDNLGRYIRALLMAGYLRIAQERVNGRPGSFRAYQLIRNTGPKPPISWRTGQVFDQNTGIVYGEPKAVRDE